MAKTILPVLALCTVGLLAAPHALQAADPAPPGGKHGDRPDPAQRLQMMTEKLGLTQDQQTKIKAIFENDAPTFKEIFSKGREGLTEADKAKLKELMKSQHEQIAAVLTPEQVAKFKEMRPPGKPGGPKGAE